MKLKIEDHVATNHHVDKLCDQIAEKIGVQGGDLRNEIETFLHTFKPSAYLKPIEQLFAVLQNIDRDIEMYNEDAHFNGESEPDCVYINDSEYSVISTGLVLLRTLNKDLDAQRLIP